MDVLDIFFGSLPSLIDQIVTSYYNNKHLAMKAKGWEALLCESWDLLQMGSLSVGDFSNGLGDFDESFFVAVM